jgi:arylsulfatase A-like enzyme
MEVSMLRCMRAFVLLASLATGAAAAQEAPGRRPNVIVIIADDLGYGDVGVYGSRLVKTPNIDALADSGARMERGYVTHPVCAPSRAALMTGRYQQRFGYEFNPVGRDRTSGVDAAEVMLPLRMKQAGYATGMVGKWHLGQASGYHPLDRGFDSFFGVLGGATSFMLGVGPGDDEYTPPGSENTTRTPQSNLPPLSAPADVRLPALRRASPVSRGRTVVDEPSYLTEAFTREALAFISAHKDRPFFLYLAHTAPHTPLEATRPYLDRYRHIPDRGMRIYAAMVSSLDDSVGEIRKRLAEEGLEKDTLIVFLSDNGCAHYVLGACTNRPLSGFKGEHLEGGVRVPFIASWPGRIREGQIIQRPVSSLDIAPTALRLAGVTPPSVLDGEDLMAFLEGGAAAPRNLFWRAGPSRAVVDDRWKLWIAEKAGPEGEPAGEHVMLFDLLRDPGERQNLALDRPDIVAELKDRLAAWSGGLGAPQWESNRQSVREYDGQKLRMYN